MIDLDAEGFLTALDAAGERFDAFARRVTEAELSLQPVTVPQMPTVASVNPFKTRRNASAMATGRVFNRPTVFDYAEGAYQIAGDAGPEAVVGVNSLQRMIESAVRGASAGREAVASGDGGRDITVVLELDGKQFGRAVYRANREESQRVGVGLATGGGF